MSKRPSHIATKGAIFFYGHKDEEYGYLSNFYPCEFVDPETNYKYYSSEQYFMKLKQETFDPSNEEIASKILKEKTPSRVKRLGRQVKNYDDEIWDEKRYDCMLRALKLKFSNNSELAKQLIDTGDRHLYETTTNDCIWGIGWDLSHVATLYPEYPAFLESGDVEEQFRQENFGTNLLGKALMETRKWLKEKE